MDTLKAFMSYSTDDKQLAGRIKEQLATFGIDVFLAHEDLTPSSEWQAEIIRNVGACDVFISLHTGSFRLSDWTDQESGMAIMSGKIIMPIHVTRNPHGFLGTYQAHPLDFSGNEISQSCKNLVLAMMRRTELRVKLQNSIIQKFIASENYLDSNRRIDLIEEFGPYESKQVNLIVQGSMENKQIYEATTARRKLKQLYLRYEKEIDDGLKRPFKKLFEIV